MRTKLTFAFLLLFGLYLVSVVPSWAEETQALEQLLNIFEKRSLISPEEAKQVRESIAREKAQLLERETAVEEKDKALTQRERELREREEALQRREQVITGKEGPGSTVSVPGEATLSATSSTPGASQTAASVTRPKSIPLEAVYDRGFCLRSAGNELFSLCLGGLMQADYRYFDYSDGVDPGKNKFDIRRSRLRLSGNVSSRIGYKFEYEFQGAGSRRLLDAYTDARLHPWVSFQVGQFKEPFSLEQLTSDKDGFFVERSMGYYLTPGRDVGAMLHASVWNDRVNYALGLFNGDGEDDASGGEHDDPEVSGRLVCAPLKNAGISWGDNLQVGGSFSHARIDPTNVEVHAKTTGLTTFCDVASRAKFNIILDADTRTRYGGEFAWCYGPLALSAEYMRLHFKDLATSSDRFSSEFEDYYVSLFWMLTGEKPMLKQGVFQPIEPRNSLWQGGWGAFGVALRYDWFRADKDAYDDLVIVGNSVREADALSIALRWYLDKFSLVVLDFTSTRFDEPLLVGRDPFTGVTLNSDRENVLTTRFQLGF